MYTLILIYRSICTHIYIYIYNSWNLDWDPWVSGAGVLVV